MDTLPQTFRERCLEATLDLLWRQWCSLGVSGHAPPADQRRLIDLEALVLATTSIGRYEPRLFDEAFDWLASFGSLINLQRLSNLQHSHQLGDPHVLQAMADWLVNKAAQPRWKAISRVRPDSAPKPDQQPLFLGIEGPTAPLPDAIFLARGLERTVFQPRGMSRAPQPLLPPNLMTSLRSLIGVSARVEIILFLAGSQTAVKAAEIAHATGYAPRTLQAVLQEMLLSGHLLTQEPPARKKATLSRGSHRCYHLQPTDWAFLTSGQPLPQWTPWAALFTLARGVLDAIPALGEKPRHSAVISSQLRETLAIQSPALAAAGLLPHLDLRPEAPGTELLQTLAERLPALITSL
ncbi:hypothetical protein BH11VER1_BH11VER1_20450 [soil metagenome]